jgi:hypothetical protein
MNDVFAFWFRARNSRSRYQAQIDEMLEDAGTEGTGTSDLENFMNDYENNGFVAKRYSDLATYFGAGPHALFSEEQQLKVPVAFKNFAESIQEKLKPLKGHCEEFYRDVDRLNSLFQRNDWTEIGQVLEKVEKYSGRAEKFLWVFPKPYQFNSKVISYSNAFSQFHGYLTQYADVRYGGQDAGIAILKSAVSFVPVFGSYYGAMVDLMPGLKDWFQNLVDKYCKRLDGAARGNY